VASKLEYDLQIVSKDDIPLEKQVELIQAIDKTCELVRYEYLKNIHPTYLGWWFMDTPDESEQTCTSTFTMNFRAVDAMPMMIRILKSVYNVPMNLQCRSTEI
jgi:hypothetical protein